MPLAKSSTKPASRHRQGRARSRNPTQVGPLRGSTVWILRSAAATRRFGARLAQLLRGGEVVALKGDLGAGKTQLAKGLAQGLGAATQDVASPTFVFIHEYRGRLPLAHIDLYRIDDSEELDQLGWADYLDGRWVVAVEWAEKAEGRLPADRIEIQLHHRTFRTREATCTAFGSAAKAVVRRLRPDAPPGNPFPSRARRRA